eukprot:m.251362 g.251362  ORF g.251362 m.251362 type:complete len:1293 (-) comp33894_c1_seq2:221-4099(-)
MAPSVKPSRDNKPSRDWTQQLTQATIVLILSALIGSALLKFTKQPVLETKSIQDVLDAEFQEQTSASCLCYSVDDTNKAERCKRTKESEPAWCFVNKSCPFSKLYTDKKINKRWKLCKEGDAVATAMMPSVAQDISDAINRKPIAHTSLIMPSTVATDDLSKLKEPVSAASIKCGPLIARALQNTTLRQDFLALFPGKHATSPLSVTMVQEALVQSLVRKFLQDDKYTRLGRKVFLETDSKQNISVAKLIQALPKKNTVQIQMGAEWHGLSRAEISVYLEYCFFRGLFALLSREQKRSSSTKRGGSERDASADDIVLNVVGIMIGVVVLYQVGVRLLAWHRLRTAKSLSAHRRREQAKKGNFEVPNTPTTTSKDDTKRDDMSEPQVGSLDTSGNATFINRKKRDKAKSRKGSSSSSSLRVADAAEVLDPNALLEDWDESTSKWIMKTRAQKTIDDGERAIKRKKVAEQARIQIPTEKRLGGSDKTITSTTKLKSSKSKKQSMPAPKSKKDPQASADDKKSTSKLVPSSSTPTTSTTSTTSTTNNNTISPLLSPTRKRLGAWADANPEYVVPEVMLWLETPDESINTLLLETNAGIAIDLWGFACTVYSIAAGRPLIATPTHQLQPHTIRLLNWKGLLTDEVELIQMRHGRVNSSKLLSFLQWALHPDPQSRPSTMVEVLAHPFFASKTKNGSGKYNFGPMLRDIAQELRHIHGHGDALGPVLKAPIELERGQVEIGATNLGMGHFGLVRKAIFTPNEKTISPHEVAVKMLQINPTDGSREELFREATITCQFSHPNVVDCIGVVTINDPCLLVVQYCGKGSLDSVLLNEYKPHLQRGLFDQNHQHQFLLYAFDIALGLAYIHSKFFVHRDIAARNILVDSNNTCKIADFGLTRNMHIQKSNSVDDDSSEPYYKILEHDRKLPLAWLSPEVLDRDKFSEYSDVWAYGITLGEIYTAGGAPYGTKTSKEICKFVLQGRSIPQPDNCPMEMYANVMRPCFAFTAAERPRFIDLARKLRKMVHVRDSAREHQVVKTINNQVQPQPSVGVTGGNDDTKSCALTSTPNTAAITSNASKTLFVKPPPFYKPPSARFQNFKEATVSTTVSSEDLDSQNNGDRVCELVSSLSSDASLSHDEMSLPRLQHAVDHNLEGHPQMPQHNTPQRNTTQQTITHQTTTKQNSPLDMLHHNDGNRNDEDSNMAAREQVPSYGFHKATQGSCPPKQSVPFYHHSQNQLRAPKQSVALHNQGAFHNVLVYNQVPVHTQERNQMRWRESTAAGDTNGNTSVTNNMNTTFRK